MEKNMKMMEKMKREELKEKRRKLKEEEYNHQMEIKRINNEKKEQNTKSIGFLFGLFESEKDECHVTEYSIQPTSLEQIFNKFASKQGHDDEAIDVEK